MGAGVSLAGAHGLGLFHDPEPSLEQYVVRANAAMAAGAWDAPIGENVLAITDEALERWPAAPAIVEVRRRSAATLYREGMRLRHSNPELALKRSRLAVRLDPSHAPARQLLQRLSQTPLPPANSRGEASQKWL
jgi:hypothetical protein